MMELRPCPACHRHVRLDEVACPFCAAGLPAASPPVLPRRRLTRAAIFVAGAALAGCGGKGKPDTNQQQQIGNETDQTAPPPDAAPVADPIEYPDHDVPKPYGAPPARQRIV
jgi:hypothetical protein